MRAVRSLALLVALLTVASSASVASLARAEVKTKEVDYKQGDTDLQGYLAWDDAAKGKRPGVLVVHEWWGLNDYTRGRARQLAKAGYVAFAVDMYGKGKVATHPQDATTFMNEATKDADVVAARFDAGRDLLMADSHVDKDKLAAIGYCFGGGVVLGRARAGEDLDAVVSFHGTLATQVPAEKGKVKARELVLTGAADPFVTPDQVAGFEKEMTDAGANFRVIVYPGAKHSFTNPAAGTYGMEQLAYNADADKRSWAEMLKMFKQVWK
jgi:dienelactone hydrolase